MFSVRRIKVVSLGVVIAAWLAPPAAAVEIQVVSNRADLVSGGDALVDVSGADPATVRVDVDGRDVTGAFAVRPNGRFQGLLTGLRLGENLVTARLPDGVGARITIANHPVGGPVFSGPQTQPWLCTTEENQLGPALDAQCNARTKVAYRYISTNPSKQGFQPYDPQTPPSDVATTTTDHAGRVPFVVRLERGVINRGIYETAVLANPAKPWEPWAPQPVWNRKLYWVFGGDCKPNHRQPADSALNQAVLGRGFAMAASGMTVLGTDCNSVVVAETVMMIKERLAETLGPIRYTMSEGCSGGSMQQHWLVSDYPGLLDGIQPSCSYPDIWETMQEAEDCHVLDHYFLEVSPHLWANPAQQDAVTGYTAQTTCHSLWDGPAPLSYAQNWLDPDNAPACSLPAEDVYHAQNNPRGTRCTLQDYMGSIFGYRAADGFANYPYDNVGVQYGLVALNSGQISAEQFVDVNEKVGGLDIDWNYRPQRSVADAEAVRTMYRAGLVTYPREAAKVPIMDLRGSSNLEIHTDFHSYAMRARLQKANGHHENQTIWTSPVPLAGDPEKVAASFDLLDTWLSRIEADRSDRTLAEKVLRNRPAAAVDACWIGGQKVTDMQKCRAAFPYWSDPRIAAGGPLADDVIKCSLKPLDRDDYEVEFSDAQWGRLQKAFPDGVCDYSTPGQFQQPSVPWMSFAGGPGGQPLGDAPRSLPLGDAPRSVPLGAAAAASAPACASAAGFRSVRAAPRNRGLRFDVDRWQGRPWTVEVFRQSAGRRVLRERRVARFRGRIQPFSWSPRRLGGGHYFARFTMRLDRGRDVRRIALRRRGGRFRLAPDFHQRFDCGTFRALKLSSSVLGGSTRAPLGIAVRLAQPADRLTIVARIGKRVIKRWQVRRPQPGFTFRRRLRASAVPKGRTVRVAVSVTHGSRRTRGQILTARRL
jgi:hypothetical protein